MSILDLSTRSVSENSVPPYRSRLPEQERGVICRYQLGLAHAKASTCSATSDEGRRPLTSLHAHSLDLSRSHALDARLCQLGDDERQPPRADNGLDCAPPDKQGSEDGRSSRAGGWLHEGIQRDAPTLLQMRTLKEVACRECAEIHVHALELCASAWREGTGISESSWHATSASRGQHAFKPGIARPMCPPRQQGRTCICCTLGVRSVVASCGVGWGSGGGRLLV